MGSMLDLSGVMNSAVSATRGSEPFHSAPNHAPYIQDILHCLNHYGTKALDLNALRRVEGIFGHSGAYRRLDEVFGGSVVSQWVFDSLKPSTPEQESQRCDIALNLLSYCQKSSSGPPLSATAFMGVLHLAYAFARDTTITAIQNGALRYPVDQQGRVDWRFDPAEDLPKILRTHYCDIQFHHVHPCGPDELSRWVPGAASGTTALSAGY